MPANIGCFRLTSCLVAAAALIGCDSATEPVAAPTATVVKTPTSRLSSSSGQIAFGRYDLSTEEAHVFIVNPDGTGEHQLILPEPADAPVWSPDGQHILLTVFHPDGYRPALVASDGSGLYVLQVPDAPSNVDVVCTAWSLDGSHLLCRIINNAGDPSGDGVFTIRASDGGELTRLTLNPVGGGDLPGGYSPDGTRFVFMRAKPGGKSGAHALLVGALFVARADGTDFHQITPYGLPNPFDDGVAHWSPDGQEILFASVVGSLYAARADGRGLRNIPLHPGSEFFVRAPDWSPDGGDIVFSMWLRKTGEFDLYTARPDGSGLARLTATPEVEDFPNWGR